MGAFSCSFCGMSGRTKKESIGPLRVLKQLCTSTVLFSKCVIVPEDVDSKDCNGEDQKRQDKGKSSRFSCCMHQ